MKTRWQGRPLQALVEMLAKTQVLKTRWQGHPLQALVEPHRQNSSFEDSMARSPAPGFEIPEPISKTQALKSRWQGHSLQAFVETMAKTQ